MSERNPSSLSRNLRTASFGFFLVLVGVFLVAYPLVDEGRAFLADLKPTPLFNHIYYPAPSLPHPVFYHILRNFSIIWSIWLGLFTLIQLAIRERPRRVAHTLGDCIFWIGAACLLEIISAGALTFGSFLGLLVAVTGLSLIIRALAVLVLAKV